MIFTPLPSFDEITLPSLDGDPPTWLSGALSMNTPSPSIAGLAVAEDISAAGCQRRCSCASTRFRVAPTPSMCTPSLKLAEIRLPAPAAAPPMTLLDA